MFRESGCGGVRTTKVAAIVVGGRRIVVFAKDRAGLRDAIAEGGRRGEKIEKVGVVELTKHASQLASIVTITLSLHCLESFGQLVLGKGEHRLALLLCLGGFSDYFFITLGTIELVLQLGTHSGQDQDLGGGIL